MTKRAAIIVLDGLGIGPAPDTAQYGDAGSDTLGNVARAVGGLTLPNLEKLGLGKCREGFVIPGLAPGVRSTAAYGIAQPASAGKDSTSGHWEICGVLLKKAFRTYPQGFPVPLLDEFARLEQLPAVSNAFGFSAGYHLQLWPFLQDLGQIQEIYGKRWMSILANCGIVQFFTPSDVETAEYLQRRGGITTGESRSRSYSGGLVKSQQGESRSESRVPLLPFDSATPNTSRTSGMISTLQGPSGTPKATVSSGAISTDILHFPARVLVTQAVRGC